MKAHNLIASVAAVLFTTATLGVLNYQPVNLQAPVTQINGVQVTDLAPINVTPSAADRRAAAQTDVLGSINARVENHLLRTTSLIGDAGYATLSPATDDEDGRARFGLIEASLAMPYYSFGNKFGRITKE